MKLSLLNKTARVILPVFMLVVLIFLTNSTVNQHFHRLTSGIVVKHAHPYEGENTGRPFQEHNHNNAELVFLELTSGTAFWIYLFIVLLIPSLFLFEIIHPSRSQRIRIPDLYFLRNYHAPPFCTD